MLALRGWLLACAVTPAWASHPLLTEDTDVLGKGAWEFELHGERSHEREADASSRATDVIVKLGYGFAENAQLEVETAYVRELDDGAATEGRTDTAVAVKWRFFEADRMSFAFKPELLLPTGREERGLGAGSSRWGANLVAAYEAGRFEFLAHVAYLRNRNGVGERESLHHQSMALRFAATEKLRLVADLGRRTDPEPDAGRVRELIAGFVYDVSDRIELGLGLKAGLNDAADDRALRAGLKLRW